jgi:hypothetical protein
MGSKSVQWRQCVNRPVKVGSVCVRQFDLGPILVDFDFKGIASGFVLKQSRGLLDAEITSGIHWFYTQGQCSFKQIDTDNPDM